MCGLVVYFFAFPSINVLTHVSFEYSGIGSNNALRHVRPLRCYVIFFLDKFRVSASDHIDISNIYIRSFCKEYNQYVNFVIDLSY